MEKTLKKFKTQRIVVLGDVILDHYIIGDVKRISPEAPVPVIEKKEEFYRLGGAANVALNIESLGGKAHLISIIGDDTTAKIIQRQGRLTDNLIIQPNRITPHKTRIIAHHQQLLRVDEERIERINPSVEDMIIKKTEKIDFDLIIISDYAKGVITDSLMKKLITLSKTRNKQIIVDPKPLHKNYYIGVTGLVPNLKEAFQMIGEEEYEEKALANKIMKKFKTDWVVITMGEKGMCGREKGKKFFCYKAFTHEVSDVTGAGDTVMAALGLSLSTKISLRESSEIANIAASISVTKLGAATVKQEEILSF
jgi:rfaE bifunctional protein kinase chain/domain